MLIVKIPLDEGLLNPLFEGYRLAERDFEISEMPLHSVADEPWCVEFGGGKVVMEPADPEESSVSVILKWLDSEGNITCKSEEMDLIATGTDYIGVKYGEDALILQVGDGLKHVQTFPGLAYVLEGRQVRPKVCFTKNFAALADDHTLFLYVAADLDAQHAPMHIIDLGQEIKCMEGSDGALIVTCTDSTLKINVS